MKDLFEDWAETKNVLLDGLTPQKAKIVNQLLENQKAYALTESAAAGSTQSHDVAGFRKVLMPMIRRVIPSTIATELVGVQAMTGPVSQVFSMRYRYEDQANDDTGAALIAAGDEAFGNSPAIRGFYSGGAGAVVGTAAAQAPGAGGIAQDPTEFPIGVESSGEGWPSSLDAAANCNSGGSGSFIEGSGGRRMGLKTLSQAVESTTRRVQAGWTVEAMQDMVAANDLSIETEMTSALGAQIVQDIDAEILSDLYALAGTVETFDGAGAGVYGAAGNYAPAYIGDRLANLGVIINRVANEIGRKTRMGGGNFIVASPMIVSVLQSASRSVFAPAVEGSFKGPNNSMLVGTLNGTIKVYSYLWNQAGAGLDLGIPQIENDDQILVGFKGTDSQHAAGYFYCPYVPLMSSGVIIHPTTFQPVMSLMTRYGKVSFTNPATSLGNSADYYGKINVTDLDLT